MSDDDFKNTGLIGGIERLTQQLGCCHRHTAGLTGIAGGVHVEGQDFGRQHTAGSKTPDSGPELP